MHSMYLCLSYVFHVFAKIFLIIRVYKKKEDQFGIYKLKNTDRVLWFHASSLGEIKSILPLIFFYNKQNKKILITTVTKSSAEYCKSIFKKNSNIIHQYAPLDTPIIVKRFLNYWRPYLAIFVESELWPNLLFQSAKNSKIILLNARLSEKSFKKWIMVRKFAKKIFDQFDIILTQSHETKFLIKKFKIEKVKYLGNLKFCESIQTFNMSKNIDKNKTSKWVAMSTHRGEESFIIDVVKKIKEKKIQSQCFLIPRHIHRVREIKSLINKNNLTYTLQSHRIRRNKNIDFFIVDSYGRANEYLKKTNAVFIGGTIVNHGGQNPLEAARVGCSIFNGPFTQNFTEIFDFLKKNKISKLTKNKDQLANQLINCFKSSNKQNTIQRIIEKKGQKILLDHINYLNPYIN
jgi:3-deoxy-D-manno-octulosonic-acid transferase